MPKVVFCWSDISGYMAACWRALQTMPNIDPFVIAFQAQTETAFANDLMKGISCRLLNLEERKNKLLIEELIQQQKPDVIVLCGWFHPAYRRLPTLSKFKNVKFIMGMDTPWCGSFKQQIGRFVLRSYLKKMACVVVPGERSWQYAVRLGVPAEKISKGLYGIDYEALALLLKKRSQSDWPKSFLFAGRYAKIKGVDILVKAYAKYRRLVTEPWPLVCCGKGPLEYLLANQAGVQNHGFVQPAEIKNLLQNAGVFILPSRFDPWPLALVEAAAAGLPVICTDACGSAVEVLRSQYGGVIVAPNNSQELTQAMVQTHKAYADLSVWGERAQSLAAPYAASIWADCWAKLIGKTIG